MADSDASTSPLMALYLRKRAELVRFFTARTSSAAEAEDVVQDLYLKIARSTEQPDSPVPYLYRLGAKTKI